MRSWRRALALIVTLWVVLLPVAAQAQAPPRGLLPGQSTTLMPDGRWLLLGGQGPSGPVAGGAFFDPRTGTTTPTPWTLVQARAWHTATLLPDGAIIVVGGMGAGSQVLGTAELFDEPTQAFYQIANTALTARARHTATLLTDGFMLIAGGVSSTGQVLAQADLLDGQLPTTPPVWVSLSRARQGATATLLPDGTVLLWAGVGPNGGPLANGEIFDPVQKRSTVVTQMPPAAQPGPVPPGLSESLPAPGSSNVPVDALLVLRFSKPLQVDTLNATTVLLSGPGGLLAATVVPAEGGRLAFISPADVLASGVTYTLTVNGSSDPSGFLLPFTTLAFTTAGAQAPPPSSPQPPVVPSPHAHQSMIPDAAAVPRAAPAQLDEWAWKGQLKDGKPHSRWMDLPPLQAPAGVTALAGQVLRLDGEPLANVTLQYGTRLAATDSTGRFLLTDTPDGYHSLLMLGHTANAPGKTYGTFEYGFGVEPKKTNVLTFTIWMPLLDTQNTIQLPGGRTQRKIIGTTSKIPGLEVHIPAGVTLRAPNGQLLESLSLTAIPIDRTPFPVEPGALAFIAPQGHGTMVESHDGAMALAGAGVRVIFPNVANHPPGTRLRFRSYNAQTFGWFTIGDLTVSPDGRQIAAGPRVTLGEVGCAWIIDPYSEIFATLGSDLGLGEPVNLSTGVFISAKTDLIVPDVIPIVLRHVYRSDDKSVSPMRVFGLGTRHDYQMDLHGDGLAFTYADVYLADGRKIHYTRISSGTGASDAVMEHTASPTRWYKSQLYLVATQGWEIKLTDGTRYKFQDVIATAPRLRAIVDRLGNTLTITRRSTGEIDRITTPNGRWMEFTYDTRNRLMLSARDNAGRQVSYEYNAINQLSRVTDVAGGVTEYSYEGNDPAVSNRMLTIKDPRGIVYLTNQYDANGRVSRQTLADQGTWQFAYTLDGNGKVTQTDATNPRGFVERVAFNADGWETSITEALGQPEAQTTTYARQAGTNFLNSMTDALGRQTTFTYSPNGYLASVTRPGPSGAVTSSYIYEPTFNRIQTITDPLNHMTTLGRDGSGNLTSITDPRGKVTTLTYDTQGQPLTVMDPLGHAWTFTYDTGDLVSIKDPTGATATAVTDAVGRPVALVDALGNRTRLDYDVFNQLTKITDPLGGQTSLGYDPNGNLLSVTDARGKVTGYAPNAMDRVQTRTDPRGKPETYAYDPNGNLRTATDRKGQPTTITYDGLDRPRLLSYADGSSTTLTWDAGDRLTQVADSLSGTITRTSDLLDRLQQEVTPQGTVTYAYDNASRRASMTVLGQPTAIYAYDAADRLMTLTQGSASVTFGYDDAHRRTGLTLPNGVVANYAYSPRNELTSITFMTGATPLGTLTYTYDAAGRRVSLGGTWARTGLPAALATATYDDANRQLTWGGQTLTYDDNGHLISAGVGTGAYLWDARGRLTAISIPGGVSATFAYDPFGRRTRKSIGGQTTDSLYDGDTPVQALSGGVVLANLLTGLGIDEYFTRMDGSGRRTLLGDALGSILALTDDAGVVQTAYTYEPFGQTTVSGQGNGNPFQYTGRENDGTGLYYYRARYYSPARQRFISEDPIGFAGGDPNLYAYVANEPVQNVDPTGEVLLAGCLGGAGWSLAENLGSYMLSGRKPTAGEVFSNALIGCASGAVGAKAFQIVGKLVGRLAARETTTVVGKVTDLKALRAGERSLLDRLPNLGSPKTNWAQNSGVLRQEMSIGRPIRDAAVNPRTGELINNTGFLRAERNLLESRGWTYDAGTTMWYPPVGP